MKFFSLLIYFFILPFLLFSQQSLKFEYLTVEKGLNHSWAKCMEIDSKGYLWIGGIDGISRYNGNDVKTYKYNENDSLSVSSDFILDITEDSKGNLWVSTFFGGLNLYNRATDSFRSFKNLPKVKGSISSNRVNAVYEDSQGRLWIGTSKGLDQYHYETNSFHSYYLSKNGKKQGIKDDIRVIYEDNDQRLWVGTTNGLYQLQIENKFIKKYIHTSSSSSISSDNIRSIYEDEQNNLWIGTLGGGINKFSIDAEKFENITTENGLTHNSVLCIDGDKDGHIYIGTEGGGLNIINSKTQEISHILSNDFIENSLNSNSIHSLLYDHKANILFIGTYNGGVNYFSKWDKDFHHIKKNVLSNKHILSFEEGKDREIFIGTDGGGINVMKNDKIVDVLTKKDGLTSNVILDMAYDKNGNLWIGTFNGGLNIYNLKTKQVVHLENNPNNPNSLSHNDVSAIYHRSNGEIWIGTMQGGLNKFDPIKKSFKHYLHSEGNPKSISNNFISKIFEDQKGNLMVQSGSTIDIYNEDSDDFTKINLSYKVPINSTLCSHEDSQGNLWMGTRNGLVYLSRSSSDYHVYTVNDGLSSNGISSILEDDAGNLWISTNKGLVKFINAVHTPKEPDFHVFTVNDGLQGLDFKAQASLKTSNGRMLFGGNNGFNIFTPEQIWLNPVKPKTVISKFKLFNKDIIFGETELLSMPINVIEELQLSHDQNILSLEFSALNFLLPQKNQYAYKLEGFDTDWNYTGKVRSAHYTNLNPGAYTFLVKASNNDGIWSTAPTSLKINIIPPFWQTTWFLMLSVVASISVIIAIIRWREVQLKEQKRILSEKVALATSQIKEFNNLLEENNHDLKEKNSELEVQAENINNLLQEVQDNNEAKIRFFTNISHELRTPLTLILGPLKQLLEGRSSNPKEDYEIMYRNANRLLKNVNQLLDFRKLESGNIQLKATENDIVTFTQNIYSSFTYLAKKKNIDYHFNTFHKSYPLWFDIQKMDNIITNLLSNAFKYTPEGKEVSITIHDVKNNNIIIEIKDSGLGISPENQNHIFDIYYQANNKINQQTAGSGIGLALIKQFVDLHHGNISLKSEEGKGSSFFVELQTGDAFLSINEKRKDIDYTKPLEHKEEEHELLLPQENTPQEIQASDDKQALLVVEDNDDIRNFIYQHLKDDFNILLAENGKIGLEKALEHSPNYIISDIMMPELNGPELCKLIKNEPQTSHIPVILLTAYSGEETQWNGYNSGADDYIIKPFDINILRKKLLNMSSTQKHLMAKFQSLPSLNIEKMEQVPSQDKFIEQAISVVKDNIDNFTFGVDDFTSHFGMSRRHLLRKVKATTNLSINEFIKNIRLKYAAELLLDPELNISEIAYQSGFNDPKYFSKCFKIEFGKTPTEFKEEHNVKL